MSLKVLIFGQPSAIANMVQLLHKQDHQSTQQGIQTIDLLINDRQFIIFCIYDRSLITEQAIGTNALLFCLDPNLPLYEEKQFIYDLIKQRNEFIGLPLIIAFIQNEKFSIKDVINYFELFKVKDRPSMIKEVDYRQPQTILDTFKWIEIQIDGLQKSSTGFNAQPKVIKMKSKYRQSEQQNSEKLYVQMLNDKKFKALGIKEQQKIYIDQEKQRIKNENMSKQLANFSKNKKMSPYEIKATQAPKIEANLHFFLKDPKNQKQPEVSIRIQTDEFKPKPKDKGYIPKKTGINISTQIQINQLFNFDKQVKPIINVITTKAIENALLQIQEQEQFSKMAKYKSSYNQRMKEQTSHETKNIDDEQTLIKVKDKLLKQALIKNEAKQHIKCRVMCYVLGRSFVSGIYYKAIKDLYNRKAYQDTFQNQLKTQFTQQLLSVTLQSHNRLQLKKNLIEGQFDKQIVQPILMQADIPKKKYKQLKQLKQKRRINNGVKERVISILYESNSPTFCTFNKYISRAFDGTLQQFIKTKQEQYEGIRGTNNKILDKMATEELPEDSLIQLQLNENLQFGKTHQSASLQTQNSICFTVTSNRYQKPVQTIQKYGVLIVGHPTELIDIIQSDNQLIEKYDWLSNVNDLRYNKNIINMDEGLVVDLKKVPSNIRTLIFFSKFEKVEKYIQQNYAENVKYASYGLQLYQYGLSIHREDINKTIKWQEIIKPVQNQEIQNTVEKNAIMICYILTCRSNNTWTYQAVNYLSKSMIQSDIHNFLQEVVHFRLRSFEIIKNQDDQDDIQPISNHDKRTGSKNKRNKQKKNIDVQVKKKMPPKFASKIFNTIKISLESSLDNIKNQLEDSIKECKQFVESCQQGYKILIRGKLLQQISQLKKVSKIGDVKVEKILTIPIEQQNQKKQGSQGEQHKQQQNSN